MGFGESGGIVDVYDKEDLPTKQRPGRANARYNLIVPSGRGPRGRKQSRWTNADGIPKLDMDYNHPGENIDFPHYHDWQDGERSTEHFDYEWAAAKYK